VQHPQQITLVSDSWTNLRGQSIVNYMLVTWIGAVFYKSIATGTERYVRLILVY